MLISVSGIDGCGKTMQVQMLQGWLQGQGKRVVVTKAYDDLAKVACLPFMESWVDDMAIMFLFQALHAQQFAATTQALQDGCVVIADRWDESYLAYHQNFGVLAAQAEVRATLNSLAFRGRIPDVGFIIEVPPSVARHRRESRGKMERLEDRSDEYYERIQTSYMDIARQRGWQILDGTKTPQAIHQQIVDWILVCTP